MRLWRNNSQLSESWLGRSDLINPVVRHCDGRTVPNDYQAVSWGSPIFASGWTQGKSGVLALRRSVLSSRRRGQDKNPKGFLGERQTGCDQGGYGVRNLRR